MVQCAGQYSFYTVQSGTTMWKELGGFHNITKVWSSFWSSGKIFNVGFGQYFAADVLQRLWRWILVKMLKQGLVNILNFKFSRSGDVWCGFWSECLVEILTMKFEQDLCLNLWYDPIGYFGKMNSTLGSVVPLAMFSFEHRFWFIIVWSIAWLKVKRGPNGITPCNLRWDGASTDSADDLIWSCARLPATNI